MPHVDCFDSGNRLTQASWYVLDCPEHGVYSIEPGESDDCPMCFWAEAETLERQRRDEILENIADGGFTPREEWNACQRFGWTDTAKVIEPFLSAENRAERLLR